MTPEGEQMPNNPPPQTPEASEETEQKAPTIDLGAIEQKQAPQTQAPVAPQESPPQGNAPGETPKKPSILAGNKGLLVAAIIVIIVAIIGLTALFSLGSTSNYKGMIEKVEQQTTQLEQQ